VQQNSIKRRCLLRFRILGILILSAVVLSFSSRAAADDNLFHQRQKKLLAQLDGGVAILQNTPVYQRNDDVEYQYRTGSDFFYITGCAMPEAVMVLVSDSNRPYVLFIEPPSPMEAIWGSGGYTTEEAQKVFGADTVYALTDLKEKLPDLIGRKEKLFFDFNSNGMNDLIQESLSSGRRQKPDTYQNLLPLIHEMRKTKAPEELEQMRKAIEATCLGLQASMKAVKPGIYEYQVQAVLEYIFRINGCKFNGFPSIVASGPNATIMHYEANNRQMKDGELLLMDVGAEYGYYSADISRTFPVNGTFTREQAEIYQLVLDAQKAAADSMIPGVPAYRCHDAADRVIRAGLYRLELITDPDSKWQQLLYYYPYINHSLGLDVHDAGNFGRSRTEGIKLEPGMVMTDEPALYFGDRWIESFRRSATRWYHVNSDSVEDFLQQIMPVYEKYRGIGIRIEDDILITADGNEVLSKNAPREIKAIEAMMKEESIFSH
jgi:Xaa-Pro aminopeptidase